MRADVTATHKSDEPLLSEQIHKGETKHNMEVLFEYRGSRRQLTASSGENLIECVTTELRRVGRSRAQVYTANVDLRTIDGNGEVYLLQKWSPQWGCYLDVNRVSDINDGDKLAVVIKPKPPSKFLFLCCWCCGMQDEPQVQGVPRHKKEAVRKNEEIQALDYVFKVDSVRHSRASEWEETQSLAPSESRETDLKEGEQYVRAESGRASWKLVPMKKCESSEMLPVAEADTQLDVPESEGVKGDGTPFESLSQQLEAAGRASNEIQSVTQPDKSHADEGEPSSAEHELVIEEAAVNKEDATTESKETEEPEPIVSDQEAGIDDIPEGDASGIEKTEEGQNPDNGIKETVNDIKDATE